MTARSCVFRNRLSRINSPDVGSVLSPISNQSSSLKSDFKWVVSNSYYVLMRQGPNTTPADATFLKKIGFQVTAPPKNNDRLEGQSHQCHSFRQKVIFMSKKAKSLLEFIMVSVKVKVLTSSLCPTHASRILFSSHRKTWLKFNILHRACPKK